MKFASKQRFLRIGFSTLQKLSVFDFETIACNYMWRQHVHAIVCVFFLQNQQG